MSFVNPLMLAGVLAAVIPILIHLIHRRKPKPRPFAAIELLLRSVERVEKRWRLKRFLLLAARVTVLAAFALAAARPLFGEAPVEISGSKAPERLAVVIDASLSMRARPSGDTSAFMRAKAKAKAIIDRLGPEDRATLIAAEHAPRALVPEPTASKSTLLAALDALEPTYAHADLSAAVTVAAQSLASRADNEPAPIPRARVVLLSDLAGHGIRVAADLTVGAEQAALDVIDVLEGTDRVARANRGLTALEVAPIAGRGPRAVEARAKLRSFVIDGDKRKDPIPTDITLADATKDVVVASVDAIPGGVVDKSLIHAFTDAGYAPIRVYLPPDTLAEDDVRYAIADVRRAIRTLIVDGQPSGVPKEDETFYLEAALAAGSPDQLPPRIITPDDLSREDLDGVYDVVVLAGVAAFLPADGARIVSFVEKGGGLWITTTEKMDTDLYTRELGSILPRPFRGVKRLGVVGSGDHVTLDAPKTEHPILSVFGGDAQAGLIAAKTRGYLLLEPNGPRAQEVLLRYSDGQPALVEARAGKGDVVVLTTSIDRDLGDLPIQPGFLPLVRRTILHLGQALARPAEQDTFVGEPHLLAVPAGASSIVVRPPEADPIQLSPTQETAAVEGLEKPGHYTVEVAFGRGALERRPELDFAVNVDPRESDLRPLSTEEASAVLRGTAPGTEGNSRWSVLARIRRGTLSDPDALPALLLVLMLLAFALEGALTAERKPSAS